MSRTGVVVKIDKNKATVALEEKDECEGCEFSRFCNVSKGGRRILCNNNKSVKVGDLVEVDSKGKNILLAGVFNFLIPILLVVVGIIIGLKIWKSELISFLLGISLLILYFLVFKFIDRWFINTGRIIPEILKVLELGNLTVCASCGKTIRRGDSIKREFEDNDLFFCSDECANRFN